MPRTLTEPGALSSPEVMTAMVLGDFGPPAALSPREVPVSRGQPESVVVRIEACGVNHIDLDIRGGKSRFEIRFPHTLGREGAGTVVSVGPRVSMWHPGDRVVVLPHIDCGHCPNCLADSTYYCTARTQPGIDFNGCYAEYVVVPERGCIALPTRVSATDAAAATIAYGTAWRAARGLAEVTSNDMVLVLGGGSVVGMAATQLSAFLGATVIAVTRSTARARALQAQGAAHVVSDVSEVGRVSASRAIDVIIDLVGGQQLLDGLSYLDVGGRVVLVGAHTGETVPFDLVDVFRRGWRVYGCRGTSRSDVDSILSLLERDAIAPLIDSVYPLRGVAEAHARMEEGRHVGKVLLTVEAPTKINKRDAEGQFKW